MQNIDKKKLLKTVLTVVLVLVIGFIGIKTGLIDLGAGETSDTQPILPVITGDPSTENETDPVETKGETSPPETKAPETKAPETKAPETKAPETKAPETKAPETEAPKIREDGQYTSKDDVALYIHTYGKLPSNFITKKEAQALGWPGGSLEPYAKGKSIGGDYFGNNEGLLPKKKGRSYTECDIDTKGKSSRGTKRIVFSNDGLIYYTDDHYESFTLLYGNP